MCVHGAVPAYLQELCVVVEDVRGCPPLRSAICIYSMYSFTEGEDVNRTAEFCIPWAIGCYQLCRTAGGVSLGAFEGRLKTYLFGHGQ